MSEVKRKREVDDILGDILPGRSQEKYKKAWEEFVSYVGHTAPSEDNVLQFFDYCKNCKKFKSSTLWSYYSMINRGLQINYSKKLQYFPRVTLLLKSYEQGYTRKVASVFSQEQLNQFWQTGPTIGEYIHVRCISLFGFFGGLRCADMTTIMCEGVEYNSVTGFWVEYTVSKNSKEVVKNKFNVPTSHSVSISKYVDILKAKNMFSGRFFKGFREPDVYINQPMGVHTISKAGKKIAEFLELPNMNTFTGHTFRRSSATACAELNTSTSLMKQHFNWKSEGTAMKYVENTSNMKRNLAMNLANDDEPVIKESKNEQKTVNIANCTNIIINF